MPGAYETPEWRVAAAANEIFAREGYRVSPVSKAKGLDKFGSNATVGTSFETVAQWQGTVANETFVSTNLIDAAVSSSASDTQTITIEGHTINGSGELTFVVQNVTLTGQTPVALSTPLARATRAFVANSGTFDTTPPAMVGVLSVYDDTDGATSGVPNTDAAVKLTIQAGEAQSQKAATSISHTDVWILTYLSAAVGNAGGSATRITIRVERRDVVNGGAWRPVGRNIVIRADGSGRTILYDPCRYIPRSHDVRVLAKSDSNTAAIEVELGGYLAEILE